MIESLLFFTMQLCVVAGSGYDCDWDLKVYDTFSLESKCPKSKINDTYTLGCADYAKREIRVSWDGMSQEGYFGMNILWHEITHAHLYSDCMAKLLDHWKCYKYSYFHPEV